MKIRVLLAVMAVTALTTTGCCGFRNILFGRGAACGSCASAAPTLNIAPPAMGNPYAAPYEQACGSEPVCGSEVAPYAADCGCGDTSRFSPAMGDGSYGGGYPDGGMIGNGVNYPPGYVPGYPGAVSPDSWAPRGEYVVPNSEYSSEGAIIPSTPMGTVVRP